MCVLVDFSPVCYGAIFQCVDSYGNLRESEYEQEDDKLSPKLIRHILLTNILYYKRQFSANFGDFVFCVDSRNPWRQKLFQYYKHNRKTTRDKNPELSKFIYDVIDHFAVELRECLGYKVLKVDGAEADDIIAVLCKKFVEEQEQVLILSSDKDFLQLQKYDGVFQYVLNGKNKGFLEMKKPKRFLYEHIIQGDRSDGIPNVLSDIKCFKKKVKQTSVMKKKLAVWLGKKTHEIEEWDESVIKRFNQNRKLIDFDHIPKKIQDKIHTGYEKACVFPVAASARERMKLSDYLSDNGLRTLLGRMSEF